MPSVLLVSQTLDNLYEAYPALRQWRQFRIGLLAMTCELYALTFLVIYNLQLGRYFLGLVVSQIALELWFKVSMDFFPAAAVIAIVGLIFDRQRAASVIVLASIIPLVILVGIWAGSW